jgi:glycosyltransferase involved in cell wall biosynthesis
MALEIYPQHLAPVAPAAETRPLVSVVIPLYNKRSSIGRAVHSVLAQSFEDLELIVVDDGSDDGSSEVLRFLSDPRMRVIRQPNQGVSVARNRGILEARGEYVAFLDGDDEWEDDFLAVLLDVLERFPEVKVAGASYQVQKPDTLLEPLAPLFGEGQGDLVVDFFDAARVASPLTSSSLLAHRDIFAATGLFPPGIHHGEDLDQWLRVGLACADKGIALTRRTTSVLHTEAENRACHRKARPHRLPRSSPAPCASS